MAGTRQMSAVVQARRYLGRTFLCRSQACLWRPRGVRGLDMKWMVMILSAAFCQFAIAATYTPKPGSPERVKLCDSLREYVIRQHAVIRNRFSLRFRSSRARYRRGAR
jgi:hypothetical protein